MPPNQCQGTEWISTEGNAQVFNCTTFVNWCTVNISVPVSDAQKQLNCWQCSDCTENNPPISSCTLNIQTLTSLLCRWSSRQSPSSLLLASTALLWSFCNWSFSRANCTQQQQKCRHRKHSSVSSALAVHSHCQCKHVISCSSEATVEWQHAGAVVQTMDHLIRCRLLTEECNIWDLSAASDWAMECTRICQLTIWCLIYDKYINNLPQICATQDNATLHLYVDNAKVYSTITCDEDHIYLQRVTE